MQMDFSAAFDRAVSKNATNSVLSINSPNSQGILYELCSVGIGGSVLSILTQFLSNQSELVIVDCCGSKWFTSYQECHSSVFWAQYCSFSILENNLIGYVDDSALIAVVPLPRIRATVAGSLNRDFIRVSEWCDLWGMKLNACMTKTMIVSWSLTRDPQAPALTIGQTVLEESDDLVILGVTFDSKMT